VPEKPAPLPDFTQWPSFPFEGDLRVKELAEPVAVEPPRNGEDAADCAACGTPDEAYIWTGDRWRVRAMDRPTGLPMVLILECRSHLDLGDLPNLLAAELGVMTVRLERAIRSLDGVARVHVNRWGDGSAHLHLWFLARPYGRLQLRGTFLSLWDDILPVIPEAQWRESLAHVAAWLAEFGGRAIAEPPHIEWQAPSTFGESRSRDEATSPPGAAIVEQGTSLGGAETGPAEKPSGGLNPTGVPTQNLPGSAHAADSTGGGAGEGQRAGHGAGQGTAAPTVTPGTHVPSASVRAAAGSGAAGNDQVGPAS
jgi:diadenosine tetraphosphate (Ap4A) HIT family hydrolase